MPWSALTVPSILLHRLLLIVELLLGNRVSRICGLVARQIDARLRQNALIVLQIPLRLLQRRLIWLRIDIHQRIALLHHLPFAYSEPPSPGR